MSKPTKQEAEAIRLQNALSNLFVIREVQASKLSKTEMKIWSIEQRLKDLPQI
jgi:hypothetical protein